MRGAVLLLLLATSAPVATKPELRAIFSREAAEGAWGYRFRAPLKFWTPTVADVEKLEARLPRYLREQLDRPPPRVKGKGKRKDAALEPPPRPKVPLAERVAAYKRQYVGLLKDGHRVVWANFFCDVDSHTSWRKSPVDVDDGGDCYFQVEYDLDADTLSNLAVNGEA
jgi:hypothetical protein